MTGIRRSVATGLLLCAAGWFSACAPTKTVRVDDVRVTPVTSADIQKAVRESGAKAVLVNVWATWCEPCRQEFPGLVSVAHKYQGQGLKVLLVSADLETELPAVKKFLAERGVEFPAYLKAEKDQEFIDGMGKSRAGGIPSSALAESRERETGQWEGALPATFLYDGTGKLRDFWEGETAFSVFEQRVVKILGEPIRTTGGTP